MLKSFLKKYWIRILLLFCAISLALAVFLTFSLAGSIKVDLNNKSLSVSAYYLSSEEYCSIYIDDVSIYSISISKGFTEGESTKMAIKRNKINAGRFINATLGEYTLLRYNDVLSVIILKNKEWKNDVVFNCSTEELTQKMYNDLLAIIT